MSIVIRRGDIFTVKLDPITGADKVKARPALIIQNDLGNRFSPSTLVAPITSGQDPGYDFTVAVKAPEGGLIADSIILLNKIRTIDRSRLGKRLGRVDLETMEKVDRALRISLGLIPL